MVTRTVLRGLGWGAFDPLDPILMSIDLSQHRRSYITIPSQFPSVGLGWSVVVAAVVAAVAAAAAAVVVVTRAWKFEPTIKGSGPPEIASQFHPGRANSYINHTKRPSTEGLPRST